MAEEICVALNISCIHSEFTILAAAVQLAILVALYFALDKIKIPEYNLMTSVSK